MCGVLASQNPSNSWISIMLYYVVFHISLVPEATKPLALLDTGVFSASTPLCLCGHHTGLEERRGFI